MNDLNDRGHEIPPKTSILILRDLGMSHDDIARYFRIDRVTVAGMAFVPPRNVPLCRSRFDQAQSFTANPG
jgi:hypothetical protein